MIDAVAIRFGFISIRWYALFIVSGLLLAIYLTMKEATRRHIKTDDILDFVLIAFPLAIVGARLYYIAFDWSYYSERPISEIFAIWNGGLAIYGGLIAGAIVLLIFSHYRSINSLDFLDMIAPGVMIAQAIGRWGNFVNQEAYGKIVNNLDYLPKIIRNQMYIDGFYRTPTFLYESIWNLLGFVIVMSVRHRKHFLKQGEVFYFYLIWYGSGRFVIEGMRTDSLMLFGVRVSQWLSIVLVIIGIVLIIWRRKEKNIPYYQE